jgi:hypothetical protein
LRLDGKTENLKILSFWEIYFSTLNEFSGGIDHEFFDIFNQIQEFLHNSKPEFSKTNKILPTTHNPFTV